MGLWSEHCKKFLLKNKFLKSEEKNATLLLRCHVPLVPGKYDKVAENGWMDGWLTFSITLSGNG